MKIELSEDQNTLTIDGVEYEAQKQHNGCRGALLTVSIVKIRMVHTGKKLGALVILEKMLSALSGLKKMW